MTMKMETTKIIKTTGLISKAKTLNMQHTFLADFFAIIKRLTYFVKFEQEGYNAIITFIS